MKSAFRIRNSWGKDWADGGYCWLPYSVETVAPHFWPSEAYTVTA